MQVHYDTLTLLMPFRSTMVIKRNEKLNHNLSDLPFFSSLFFLALLSIIIIRPASVPLSV